MGDPLLSVIRYNESRERKKETKINTSLIYSEG